MNSTLISAIEGNGQLLDGGAMFGNAPRPVWEKWIAPDSLGRIPLACRSLLIEFGSIKILCETGIGAFFEPKMSERFGVQDPTEHLLLKNLKAIQVDPSQIDYVILSHLHFDHAGGLLPTYAEIEQGNDQLVFSKATFLVGQEAWQRANQPHPRDKASFIPGLTEKLQKSGRLLVIPRDPVPTELKAHIEFSFSNGHTPGHMHTLFKGHEQSVYFCGDLVPGKAWVHLPITMGYDRYAEMVIDEKASVYQRAVPENWLMFFTHDPSIVAATLQKNEAGRFETRQTWTSLQKLKI